jgi:hypothetical protein
MSTADGVAGINPLRWRGPRGTAARGNRKEFVEFHFQELGCEA